MLGNGVLLSLVLIMRDAEQEIVPCLESCAEAVDEIIICDTGSRDHSVARAKKFLRRWLEEAPGRRGEVCRFKWRDDFAAARNSALARAHGRWMLVLDTDERITAETKANLRPLVEEMDASPYEEIELWRHQVDMAGRPVPEVPDDWAVRLARILPGLHYQGEVHEQLLHADGRPLRQWSCPPERLTLLHTGYRPEERARKTARNFAILRREAGRGGSTFLLDHYLADACLVQKKWAEAARYARASLKSARPVHDVFAPWRQLYKALNALEEEARRAAGCALQPGEPLPEGDAPALAAAREAARQVEEALAEGLAEFPDYPDFYYFRGGRRWNAGEEAAGLADLERAAVLEGSFRENHPDQHDGFGELRPALEAALAQARAELAR